MEQILLHVCCGPDLTYSYVHFSQKYEVIGFFTNSNIDTEEEFFKRAGQADTVGVNLEFKIVTDQYRPEVFLNAVEGMENLPEMSERCMICHRMNLERTAEESKARGIKYFSTTLTISPHKNAEKINSIGEEIAEKNGLVFVSEILRKNGGFAKSVSMSKEMNLYRQNYCGCRFSRRDCGKGKTVQSIS